MNTATEIANLALRHLGTGKQISDIDADTSDEAKILNSIFYFWMDTVLRGYNWNFATVYLNTPPIICYPNQAWNFAYRYPADCFFLRRFWNGTHLDDRTNVIPYAFTNDAQGRQILSNWGPGSALASAVANMPNPIPYPTPPTTNFSVSAGDIVPVIEYTQNFTNIQFVPPDFIWAFSLMLAGWAAPSLPSVGAVDFREKNLLLGSSAMTSAMARDAMEAKPDPRIVGELTKSRRESRLRFTVAGWSYEGASFIP